MNFRQIFVIFDDSIVILLVWAALWRQKNGLIKRLSTHSLRYYLELFQAQFLCDFCRNGIFVQIDVHRFCFEVGFTHIEETVV